MNVAIELKLIFSSKHTFVNSATKVRLSGNAVNVNWSWPDRVQTAFE